MIWRTRSPLTRDARMAAQQVIQANNRADDIENHKAYHSTPSSYSRGVSVLIHKTLVYQELDSIVDSFDRFVFLC